MAQTQNLLHRPLDMEKDGIDIVIHQQIGETADDVVTIRISLDQAVQVGKFLLGSAAAKIKSLNGADLVGFEEFWKAYPRKENKAATLALWGSKKCSGDSVKLMMHLSGCKDSEQWVKDGGRFVPMASTYLRQQRYLDDSSANDSDQYR
jgi:hypothetical protein